MKRYLYFLSIATSAFIIGCGDSSSVSDQQFSYDTTSIFGYSKEINYKDYLVEVIDDPVIKATIKATNCESFEEIGNGKYLLKKCIAKPTYIEVKNGIIETKDGNISQDFPLLLNVSQTNREDDFIVTPLTTILVNANENNITTLANKLGVDKSDLFNKNEDLKDTFPKINTILITSASQGAITNKVKFLDVVRDEVIRENPKEINISKVINNIKNKSIENPNLFGLVVIKVNNINNEDPLQSLVKLQNTKSVTFYGLVFDKIVKQATITIKDLDSNKVFSNITAYSDENGAWKIEVEKDNTKGSLYYTIMNENHLLQLTATKKEYNKNIILTSTITTEKLRSMLQNGNIISPTKDNSLIISNITTAQDAILDKKGALNIDHYESNLSKIRVYNQDRIVKVASIIKSVVDENAPINANTNNTYDLAKQSIQTTTNGEIEKVNTNVVNYNINQIEKNITTNTILSSQLNTISLTNDKFQEAAQNAQYTFYRVLAYYKENQPKTDNNFVREYTKIVVYPGHYESKTCYLYGDSTNEWQCDKPQIVENNSNFTLGHYEVNNGNQLIQYSLDFNSHIFVPNLNKDYRYYGVIKSITDISSGNVSTEPMLLVDSFDVVDAFRRMPEISERTFNELKDIVVEYNSKEEVNYALNRWVKKFINEVNEYFEENGNTLDVNEIDKKDLTY